MTGSLTGASFAREVITLQTGWKFAKGPQIDAYLPGFDDSKWQEVKIPHDWAIEGPVIRDGDGNTGKLPWKGEGWYRLRLNIPARYSGKQVCLLFDGIMAFPEIYINGNLAGKWDYGYNSFWLDVTKFLHPGENLLAIHADTRNHDSRWYPGAGIYRKIQMIVTDPVHTDIWGTYVTIPVINEKSASVMIRSLIRNDLDEAVSIKVQNTILDPAGDWINGKELTGTISQDTTLEVETTVEIPNPHLWDVDDPALYQVRSIVFRDNKAMDTSWATFGIRTIEFTADSGFWLNGRRVQLKGVNLHHDQGPLGAAFHLRAAERQLEIMKSMGCNALRTSHNMAAPEMLDLCDKMGILVFDEGFDKYDGKADITPATDFREFAKRNMKNFIIRDRNHPSVFIWSVGNEMHDVQNYLDGGFEKLKIMVELVRKYDPTRPVTMACDDLNSSSLRHFDYYDVHSWNYGRRYRLARQMEPGKSVIVSESASTVSTRGFYEFPLPKKPTDFTNSLQVSSYDLNAPWWAELADDDFKWQEQEPYIAGEFVWTGFDYLGEPTPYNNEWVKVHRMSDSAASRSSYFGIVDLCGIPKDRYWLYQSHWKPQEAMVHILPHWNWPGRVGDTVPVFVYTTGDSAELFLNGKSLGFREKKPGSSVSIERYRLMWNDVIYQQGEIKAIAYKGGKVIGEDHITTSGVPSKIRLTPDRSVIKADGSDLSFILIEALDKDGNLCPLADNNVNLALSGPGSIAGVGNGNPQSFEPFKASMIRLFNGKAMVIVESGFEAGTINLTAGSEKLQGTMSIILVE